MTKTAFALGLGLAMSGTSTATTIDWKVTDYSDISVSAGESVFFQYGSSHDLYEFDNAAAYDACDFANATLVGGTRDGGGDGLEVRVDQSMLFGCSKSSHCTRGQRIAVNVASNKAASQTVKW